MEFTVPNSRIVTASDDAYRVIVSVNPKAGGRSGTPLVEGLKQALTERGFSVSIYTDIEEVQAASQRWHQTGELRAVVAAGGDGTVSLVVNTVPVGVPVAVLPLGTENLLSKYLEVQPDPEMACELIRRGRSIRLDAGLANGRLFLLMAGCGFDADVVRRLHEKRTGHIRHYSYVKPILDSVRNYQYPELRIYSSDAAAGKNVESCVKAKWAFAINLPRYAGGLSLAPSANGLDGLLDVCTFREGSFWSGLIYLAGVITGQHESWQDCVTLRTGRLRIESDADVPYQLDGDPGGFLPLDIEVLPGRLTLLASSEWIERQLSPDKKCCDEDGSRGDDSSEE